MALKRAKRVFLGSKLRIAASIVLVLVLVGVSAVATGLLGTPSVVGVENRFTGVNKTTTTIESDLMISNPNPIGVQLGGTSVDYAVEMNGITMATGTKRGVGIESGNSTLNFTTYLQNERIPDWWTSHVKNGERTTLVVDANVNSSLVGTSVGAPPVEREISTDVASSFNSTETRPISANQPLVSDPVLYLNETSGRWGTVTETETPIEMTFTVYNPKPYPIAASSIGYDVTMNDVAMGSGSTERSVTVPPGETRTIHATTVLRNQKLDEWWVTHLERNQVTALEIQFYARFDLSAAGGGTVRIPLDDVTHTIETDMFGNKDEDRGDTSGGTDGDDTATATEAEPSSTESTTDADDGVLDDVGESTATDAGLLSSGDTETPSDGPAGETPTETATDDGGSTTTRSRTRTTAGGETATTSGAETTTTDGGGILGYRRERVHRRHRVASLFTASTKVGT